MTELLAAAREVCGWLDEQGIRSCVIGGLAVQRWGEPRLTGDVDLTLVAEIGSEEPIVDACLARFAGRGDDPREFALRYRVLRIWASNGVEIDLALGATSFEIASVGRATPYELEPGCVLRMCSAEDLIVHKSVAGRERDLLDITGIVNRNLARLDVAYIRRWLAAFADITEKADLARPFEDALKAAQVIAAKRKRPR